MIEQDAVANLETADIEEMTLTKFNWDTSGLKRNVRRQRLPQMKASLFQTFDFLFPI